MGAPTKQSIVEGTIAHEWRAVVGYEGIYEVSSHGDVRSIARGFGRGTKKAKLTGHTEADGRRTIVLYNAPEKPRSFKIHTLVLTAFVGPKPHGMECCHNDGNPGNNHLSNLRWGTHSDNEKDKTIHKTKLFGERAPWSKLSATDVSRIKDIRMFGETYKSIAKWFGVSIGCITGVTSGVNWAHDGSYLRTQNER